MAKKKISRKELEWRERWKYRDKGWFGAFLVVVGLIWLAMDMGWIPSIPFWPLVVILLGLFLLAKRCW